MEVGRVGDLRIRDGSIVRLPLVGSRLYEWQEQKKGLTRAGLLMEVADDPLEARRRHFERSRIIPRLERLTRRCPEKSSGRSRVSTPRTFQWSSTDSIPLNQRCAGYPVPVVLNFAA